MLLVTADQMREMDRSTIQDIGIAGVVLMERASLGAVEALEDHFDLCSPTRIGLLCGGGNNGGDGFAMARMLTERGHEVWIGAMRASDQLPRDAGTNADILDRLGEHVTDLSAATEEELAVLLDAVPPCTIWVDALFGTGLTRDVEGSYAAAIQFLNSQPRVFAVDIPSGIDSDHGRVLGVAVRAEATAALGLPKLGHALYPGREHAGVVYSIDIGLPAKVIDQVGWTAQWLTTPPWIAPRSATMHKGLAGRVVVIGGEPGKSGSILMTTKAALLSGAGLVTVATYDECVGQVAVALPEAMAAAVVATTIEQRHADALDALLEWGDVIVAGPGLGTHDGAFEVLQAVLTSGKKVVLDADALTLLAEHRMQLHTIDVEALVITPHPGEAARLCGCTIAEILDAPVARALEMSSDWASTVVLKGASTIIADSRGNKLAVNATGNPGMATAGMGDALAGIIAVGLCESGPEFVNVCNAVWIHGAAGDEAAANTGERGLTVSALLDALPTIWKSLEER